MVFKMSEVENNLEDLTKEELIKRVRVLETHVNQLRNIISKQTTETEGKKQREFDFKRYRKRHVALKVCYLGWDYQGLVVQEDTQKTVENEVFSALIKTKLIESRETSNYHRCGRTDKEVSAYGQVLSIDLRSIQTVQNKDEEQLENLEACEELNYCHILNKVLPSEIRVVAWAPVDDEFSARFSCTSRTYKYFFPRGELNIERMKEACSYLIGEHDFRNLCKMDVGGGVTSFVRRVYHISIDHTSNHTSEHSGYDICQLTVKGQSFLWHQIRCMVAILFLIGQGLEEPTVIRELLNIEKNPCKPQYNMTEGFPLVLFECEFENVDWYYDKDAFSNLVEHMQTMWSKYAVRAAMIKQMLNHLESVSIEKNMNFINKQNHGLLMGSRSKIYKPLLNRPRCESLENRLDQMQKRRKKQ